MILQEIYFKNLKFVVEYRQYNGGGISNENETKKYNLF